MKICTFFGQSIIGNQDKYIADILRILDKEIGEDNVKFLIGGIEGMVPTALLCCYIYKTTHPNTKLILVPTSNDIPPYLRKIFDIVFYSALEDETPENAIKYRNHYIVDHCNLIITNFYDTADTVFDLYLHAEKMGKTVYNLHDPVQFY